ncbi:hypothetical protein [Chryseobacterium sp. 5_R23647]|uniref:hypothetical protein n=1 Tax=Chryseobacterium sp. 5_R23647 TaxID=2258964 RepID=UPI000F4EC668|nr:hypothetical protein [Chryseobacterium sp. 5_R23647]
MKHFITVLQFDDIFPDEEKLAAAEYLKRISTKNLLSLVGFCNTTPLPNYYNFFSNPRTQKEIERRVNISSRRSDLQASRAETISPYSVLKIAEIIFSDPEILKADKTDTSDDEELDLFKAFLVINGEYNTFEHDLSPEGNEGFINFQILQSFQLSELSLHQDDQSEFGKLLYVTIYKIEELLRFLNAHHLLPLKSKFLQSFNVKSEHQLLYEMKYLFGLLMAGRANNRFIYDVKSIEKLDLLENLIVQEISTDEDFTDLKKYPIYRIDETTISVINYHYAIDLFYRSAKFRLKDIYNSEADYVKKYGDFFSYFNKRFSEEFLMKNLLDSIFEKKYFHKKKEFVKEQENEPDYYVRYNNAIYLFENKDVLISKGVKASRSIQPIFDFLRQKFFLNKKKKVGIQQLIFSIKQIVDNEFPFDDGANKKQNFEIFPVLIVHDRILQAPGINYILNKWFKEELRNTIDIDFNKNRIHNLTLIDIDTLITWEPHIKNKISSFKKLLLSHSDKISRTKFNHKNIEDFTDKISKLLTPISLRATPFFIDKKKFMDKFETLRNKTN